MEFPPLYCKSKTGKIVQWRVFAEGDTCITEYGQINGKKTEAKTRCKPTNVGRANARTAEQQAEFEAEAAWVKKKKEGYAETAAQAASSLVILPMLAHPYKQEKNGKIRLRPIKFPCFVQYKYNGLRCLATVLPDGSVEFTSRQGVHWTGLSHIRNAIAAIGKPGDIFDGELYCHGIPLQTINSLVKCEQPDTALLSLVLYDMPMATGQHDGVWEDRWQELNARLATQVQTALALAPTRMAASVEEVERYQADAVKDGYEGLILRLPGHRYLFNDRSDQLLKFKTFEDAEFEIVDVRARTHSLNGTEIKIVDIFEVKNDRSDAIFEVVPRGTMEQRAQWLQHASSLIGKMLVVRFLERSIAGIPQGNPVGIAIRESSDLPLPDDDSMYQ